MKNNLKAIREEVSYYKLLKADLHEIEIQIEECKEDNRGISELPQGEKVSGTNKFNSPVENQAQEHEESLKRIKELEHEKFNIENRIKRIDNALSILNEDESYVINYIVIGNCKKYFVAQNKLHVSYQSVKRIEYKALRKMGKYLN